MVQHLETDEYAVADAWFSVAFETAESYKIQYHTSEHYETALQYLKRLYTIREQASPLKLTRSYIDDSDTFGSFAVVLRTLIEEL